MSYLRALGAPRAEARGSDLADSPLKVRPTSWAGLDGSIIARDDGSGDWNRRRTSCGRLCSTDAPASDDVRLCRCRARRSPPPKWGGLRGHHPLDRCPGLQPGVPQVLENTILIAPRAEARGSDLADGVLEVRPASGADCGARDTGTCGGRRSLARPSNTVGRRTSGACSNRRSRRPEQ